jgi:hypothetical protein
MPENWSLVEVFGERRLPKKPFHLCSDCTTKLLEFLIQRGD